MERIRKAAAVAMVALAGALMMGGCTSDSDTGAAEPSGTPAAEAIVGTWYEQDELGEYTIVEYLDDGTWAAYDADTVDTSGTPKDFGEYTVEGDTLTLGPDDYCGETLGTYTFALTGDQLMFTLVSDDCDARRTDITNSDPMTRVTE